MKQFKMKRKNKTEDIRYRLLLQDIRLLGTLGASLLGNMFTGIGMNRAEKGCIRAGYRYKRSSIKNF